MSNYEPDDAFTESGFDRKARYVKSVNPQEKERLADLRARFTHAEAMDESLDNLTADEYFDRQPPTDAVIMREASLTQKQWDAIRVKNRELIADYLICHCGGKTYYRRELVGVMKSLRSHLLEAISKAELLKAQAARARARSRGGVKGRVCSPEQRARMSEGQKRRYAQARMKKQENS